MADLVTNGTFATDTVWDKRNTGATTSPTNFQITGGQAVATFNLDSGQSVLGMPYTGLLTEGASYTLTFDVSDVPVGLAWFVNDGISDYPIGGDGSKSIDIVFHRNSAPNDYDFYFYISTQGFIGSPKIDNVSLFEVGWTYLDDKACYVGTQDKTVLYQESLFTIGDLYVVKFTISGQTQGKLRVASISGTHIYEQDGVHIAYGQASTEPLIFIAEEDNFDLMFDGCIDNVEVYNFSQIEEYAVSPCIQIQEDQGCLVLLEATNDNTALGFDWEGLTLSVRIDAKFAKVLYKTESTSSLDSSGDKSVIYFDGQRLRNFLIEAVPVYMHDFLYMCMAVDGLSINGVDWGIENEEYPSIKWNKEFKEGTVELELRKKISKLNKSNC